MTHLWKRQSFFSKYSDRNVERVGRKDGRLSPPIPPWLADNLPPFLMELKQAGDSDIQLLTQEWGREDKTLWPDWKIAQYAATQAEAAAKRAETTTEEAEEAYRDKHGGKAAPTDQRFILYKWAMTFLALCEIPFNAIVFRSVGESEVMTTVFTLALATSVVLCAHLLGIAVHKTHSEAGKTLRTHTALVTLLVLIPLGVMSSIAYFRAHYLSTPRSSLGLPAAARFDEGPTLLAFFFFNVVLFLVAFACSFYVHDPLLKVVFRRRRELARARQSRALAQRTLDHAHGRREKRYAHYNALARQIGKNVNRLLDAYRTHNLQCRQDRGEQPESHYPGCFDKYGGIDVPEELKTLTWDEPAGNDERDAKCETRPSGYQDPN